ncbi:helix-turn-helix domain-containing protein [Nocardia thailandica]
MGMDVARANAAIGAALRGLRAERDWSREELAERSGVPAITIRRIESGDRAASITNVIVLCRVLGVSPGEFLDSVDRKIEQAGGLDAQ